jgi:hypothetical protein
VSYPGWSESFCLQGCCPKRDLRWAQDMCLSFRWFVGVFHFGFRRCMVSVDGAACEITGNKCEMYVQVIKVVLSTIRPASSFRFAIAHIAVIHMHAKKCLCLKS